MHISDLRRMNNQAMYSVNTGMIILGGGVCKHHTCNANLMVSWISFNRINIVFDPFNLCMWPFYLFAILSAKREVSVCVCVVFIFQYVCFSSFVCENPLWLTGLKAPTN